MGGGIAAVVNLVLLFGAGAAGVAFVGEFQPGQPAAALGAVPVLVSSIVPAIPGGIVALILTRFASQKAALIFGIIAVVFTLLTLGGPPNVKGLSTGGLVVMELMHVVAAAGIGEATLRLSIGLEDVDDLIDDLKRGFRAAAKG
jgi:hypothetical protein